MTPDKNIIDTVKELQATYETLYPIRELNDGEKKINAEWHRDVCINFPAIAEALLIAVEGLEYYESEFDNGINGKADEVLARLRSLS